MAPLLMRLSSVPSTRKRESRTMLTHQLAPCGMRSVATSPLPTWNCE